MKMSLHLIGSVSFNLLVLVGLTYLLSRLEAARPDFRRAYAGAAFGIAAGGIAVILMLASFYSSRGLLIDLRSVVLLMAGTLGGPVAAIVATARGRSAQGTRSVPSSRSA
jgi:hypothetical protein